MRVVNQAVEDGICESRITDDLVPVFYGKLTGNDGGSVSMPFFDAEKFKAATREQWDRHAQGWNAESEKIRQWLRPSTDAMIEMANVRIGSRVLDVAALAVP